MWRPGPSASVCVARAAESGRCRSGKQLLRGSALGWLYAEKWLRQSCLSTPGGEPLSRWGVAYVLKHHAAAASRKCCSISRKRLSPHVLRHTSAMIVLQATQDIRKVSLWLGHSNLATTEIYVRADPGEKLEAIEAVVPPHLRKGRFRPTDKLMAFLKAKP